MRLSGKFRYVPDYTKRISFRPFREHELSKSQTIISWGGIEFSAGWKRKIQKKNDNSVTACTDDGEGQQVKWTTSEVAAGGDAILNHPSELPR